MTKELSPERIKRKARARIKEEKYWESLASEVTITNNNDLRQENKMQQDAISWGELAELTHVTQVERFNFCTCEEQEYFPYDDCPKTGEK